MPLQCGMRILIAADSFKDALAAPQVCAAIAEGLRTRFPNATLIEHPLADGGEGTIAVIAAHRALSRFAVKVRDPLDRTIKTHLHFDASSRTAFIELAQASGLELLPSHERNVLLTSTFGTGELIAKAIEHGAHRIVLTIGGSATNDAGIGMASALGRQFLDKAERIITPTGASLGEIEKIIAPTNPQLPHVDVLCDVTNPLFGPEGAAYTFAEQKGATPKEIELLDRGLRHLAKAIEREDISDASPFTAGAGAAGGVGFGAMAFLRANLHRGIDYMLNLTHFDDHLKQCDLVITGEGRLDSQTSKGKLIFGICQRAQRTNVPVIALCGELKASDSELRSIGLRRAFDINAGFSAHDAIERTAERLEAAAAKLALNFN